MKVTISRGKFALDTRVADKRVRKVLNAPDRETAEALATQFIADGGLIPHAAPRYARYRDYDIKELFRKTRERARVRNIDFTLSEVDVFSYFERSLHTCEISGIAFDRLYRPPGTTKRPFAASVDRINSGAGYSVGNCRLVCVAVNIALGEWGTETFFRICQAVSDHSNRHQ